MIEHMFDWRCVVSDQQERLRRARAVLMQAERRQDVKSSSETFKVDEVGRGVYHLEVGAENLALALAQVARPGHFIAVVGVEDIAWEGVEELGVDVSHVVLIRSTGDQGMKVIGSLLEGFSLVVVGDVALAPRYQRALAARARTLGATILSTQPWIGVSAPLFDSSVFIGSQGQGSNPLLRYRQEAS